MKLASGLAKRQQSPVPRNQTEKRTGSIITGREKGIQSSFYYSYAFFTLPFRTSVTLGIPTTYPSSRRLHPGSVRSSTVNGNLSNGILHAQSSGTEMYLASACSLRRFVFILFCYKLLSTSAWSQIFRFSFSCL